MFNYCRTGEPGHSGFSNYFRRLSYNQTGGIFTDSPAGLPLVWTWNTDPRESILETVHTVGANASAPPAAQINREQTNRPFVFSVVGATLSAVFTRSIFRDART